MKKFSTLCSFLLKSVTVLCLVAAAGLAGVGVAALFAFHNSDDRFTFSKPARPLARVDLMTPPRLISLARIDRWDGERIMMDVAASLSANRFVAAGASDKPQYAYADNQSDGGGARAILAARRSRIATTIVPPPLSPPEDETPALVAAPAGRRPLAALSDPGSHYIVDKDTGRIIGIDGRAGAMADELQEQEQQQQQQQQTAARIRPVREVRAALPVSGTVVSDLPPPKPNAYPAIRRAMPVDDNVDQGTDEPAADAIARQPFNAAAEFATDGRPVLRAVPVVTKQPVPPQPRLFTFP